MIELNKIYCGNALDLDFIPDGIVDCTATSPPYYALRNYENEEEQIGLERTPEEYVENLVRVFTGVYRITKDTGVLFLNLGDSYWGGKGKSGSQSPDTADERYQSGLAITKRQQQLGGNGVTRPTDGKHESIKQKDLIGIP